MWQASVWSSVPNGAAVSVFTRRYVVRPLSKPHGGFGLHKCWLMLGGRACPGASSAPSWCSWVGHGPVCFGNGAGSPGSTWPGAVHGVSGISEKRVFLIAGWMPATRGARLCCLGFLFTSPRTWCLGINVFQVKSQEPGCLSCEESQGIKRQPLTYHFTDSLRV